VVIVFQILVADLAWPGPIKYALVMGGTVGICLASYHGFVRYTFIGATLNGKRERPVPAPVTP
jgi:glucan biosynthesis protein C